MKKRVGPRRKASNQAVARIARKILVAKQLEKVRIDFANDMKLILRGVVAQTNLTNEWK